MKSHPQEGFYARFLGGFSLDYEGEEIRINRNLQNISMQMLLMLLKAGVDGIEKKELLAIVRPDQWDLKKRQNNFRQQIHILRGSFEGSGFPEGEYVVSAGSRFHFTMEHAVRSDTQRLDHLIEKLKEGALEWPGTYCQEAQTLYKAYCQAYTGEFLPMLGGEEWVAVESAYYQKWYSTCIHNRCQLLKEQGQYEAMLELCTAASHIHAYDEWQAGQIECLMAMDRYGEAQEIYEGSSEIFYKDLVSTSLDEVMSRYQGLEKRIYGKHALARLKQDLEEKEREEDGPFYCSYPSFQDAYRFIARLAERTGAKNLLLLCTLTEGTEEAGKQLRPLEAPIGTGRIELWPGGEDGTSAGIKMRDTETDDLEEKMGWLKKVLVDQLRTGDFYTRYSQTQYLALLAEAKEEDGEGILDRLERAWEGYGQEGKTEAEFSLVEMDV